MDGTQTHAKAYPGTRHLQVLKGFGANAIVASICPKNVMANGSPAGDPDYGYNPAVGAIIERLKEALIATCLPRPLVAENDEVPCTVVEAYLPAMGEACSCAAQGRSDLVGETAQVRGAVEDELIALSLCGGQSGIRCGDYCMCEIQQFAGAELNTCQTSETDPMNIYGYCYVDPDNNPTHNPALVADCPDTQRQIIRFLGPDVPRPRALGFIACLGGSVSAGSTAPTM